MKKVYISGRITGLSYPEVARTFKKAENALKESGFEPINPVELVPYEEGKTWEEYMKDDLKLLLDCDHILMLRGWEDSRGATFEKLTAETVGIEVIQI